MDDITLEQLKQAHASNPHRQDLLAKLRAELQEWGDYLAAFNVWLFGSFLTAKDAPGDIDVLLAGCLKSGTAFPPKLPRPHKGDIHVISLLGTRNLATRDELIKKFNEQESNAEKGIQLSAEQVAQLIV